MPIGDGSPLDVYDANSVRDRIRRWQSQGGGVIATDDFGTEDDKSLSKKGEEHTSTRRSEQRRCSRKEVNGSITPSRSGRSAVKADNIASIRTASRSAPAKRVVSDQHWRKKQSPLKSKSPSKPTEKTTPTRMLPDDGNRVKPDTEQRPEEKRRCASARTTPRRDISSSNDDHVSRAYVTQSEPRTRPERRQSGKPEHVAAGGIDLEDTGAILKVDSETKRTFESAVTSGRKTSLTSKAGSQRRRSSLQKDELEEKQTRGAYSEERGSLRSHKGTVLSKLFTKQPPEPIITPSVPSIEQWLHETPDPFVDPEQPPIEEVAPLRPSPRKRKVTPQETIVEEPNQIWDALTTKEGAKRAVPGSRRRKRIPSSAIYEDNPFPPDFDAEPSLLSPTKGAQTERASKLVDLAKESPKQSLSSLSRRGANKSLSSPLSDRRMSRKEKETKTDDNTVTATVSQTTISSVEELNPIAPLQPPGLGHRRPFPSIGEHRLSTIASVETFSIKDRNAAPSISSFSEQTAHPTAIPEDEATGEACGHFDFNSLGRKRSRLTKHADLISILSLPRGDAKSIQSARSIRTNRSRLATATIDDLMQELATDETKYMRELRTLVDGVIPVLLSCVLSKSDSAVAAGLFRPSTTANEDPNFTKPIVDMGIALERLKTLHKRMPTDPDGFLTWAHGAQRVYTEYLKSWRMGFQDVVVNLAPAVGPASDLGLEEGLPRNAEGDVLNGDGERVDVAFLLKRPLVRLKYLAKTLKGLHFVRKSTEAELLATKYQKLVEDARQRSNEERARLEDEAAANIDPTRARDPRTLAPLLGVVLDRTRRVRARDHFNLALQHSSGQRVDCRVELLFRDEASGDGAGGDVLICEVDGTGRWLLFPPVQLDAVSARNGDLEGEIIIMVRGISSNGNEWQEVFVLVSEDENAGFEWVQMLGLTPVPPKISRSQSFVSRHQKNKTASDLIVSSQEELPCEPTSFGKSRTPSPREVEVPIGELPRNTLKAWTDSPSPNRVNLPSSPSSRDQARQQTSSQHQSPSSPISHSRVSKNYVDQVNDLRSLPSQNSLIEPEPFEPARTPRSFKEALGLSGSSNPMGLKRASAKRLSRRGDASPRNKRSPISSPTNGNFEKPESEGSPGHEHQSSSRTKEHARPPQHRSLSSTPSVDLPHIPKARKNSPPTTPITHSEEDYIWSTPLESNLPASRNNLTKKRPSSSSPRSHPVSTSPVLDTTNTPVFEKGRAKQRRSSSPLKNEYDPSTASDTASDSGASTVERNEATSVSDDSSDEELEDGDVPTPLLPFGALKGISKSSAKPPLHSSTNGSIKPSESASQAPYKMVPAQPAKACKTIASIFTWLDSGKWEQLHPDECSIVITPGLIEAFEMSAAHSHAAPPSSSTPVVDTDKFCELASTTTSQNDNVQGDRPLVAIELTPLVPLRRGTALDISIRSPPTPQSQITSGNNIMFRSRNPEECEALYALINYSRIHNPTFIALENARGPYPPGGSIGVSGNRRPNSQAGSNRSSWFGGWGRSSSYRASSRRTPSLAPSESSIGSMSSAFSALKRFSTRNNGIFNIAQSTIGSRTGSRAGSIYTGSDNSSGSGANSPIPPGMIIDARKDAPIGLIDAKIRIYIRETASKWRDMGSARLTIKRVETNVLGPDGRPMSSDGVNRQLAREKRIIINGKTKGEVLLDVQLGESCFERVARTGIAVSVWEDVVGPNGEIGVVNAVGGVSGGRAKVYMIQVCYMRGELPRGTNVDYFTQMKSEAETAYTFSIVGKLRY